MKHKVVYFIMSLLLVGLTFGNLFIFAQAEQSAQANTMQHEFKMPTPVAPSYATPTLFGAYLNEEPNADNLETELGNTIDIVAWFEHWTNGSISKNKLTSACTNGQIPLITWETWGGRDNPVNFALEDIADGVYDKKIVAFLSEITEVCGDSPVIIRFNHELEMRPSYGEAWYPWQGQPEEYIAAWRRVVTISHTLNPNIKWLWSPNRADEYTKEYYPGDAYIDYVGLTLNHPPEHAWYVPTFKEFYGGNKEYLEAYGKPIIIGETAFEYPDEARRVQWVHDLFQYMSDDPNIVAFVWFNQQFGHLDYRITATPAVRDAFSEALADFVEREYE